MAVKSLYFKNTAPTGASTSRALQDGGTAPTAAITTTGWTVARLTATNHSAMLAGTERASGTFAAADAIGSFAASACWRTENALTGTFANTNWTLAFRVRAVSSATAQTGAVKIRIWRSANADGTGATQLTGAVLTGTTTAALSTSASATSTVTWTPGGTVALSNEYLWVQCEWSIIGTATNNAADVLFYVESAGVVTTPNFVASYAMPADVSAVAVAAQPAVLRVAHKEVHATSSILVTGIDAGFSHAEAQAILTAEVGAISVLTPPPVLRFGHVLKAAPSSQISDFIDDNGVANFVDDLGVTSWVDDNGLILGGSGSVMVTGIDATLRLRRVFAMLAAPGGIVVTGLPAELTRTTAATGIVLTANAGAIAVTGSAAGLVHTVAEGDPVLAAAPAAIAVSVASAALSVTRVAPPLHVSQMAFGRPARMNMFRW